MRKHLGLRCHDIFDELGVTRDIHLCGTELGELGLAGVGPGADPYRSGLAEAPGQRQQLTCDLLYLAVRMVDEHQNLCHDSLSVERRYDRGSDELLRAQVGGELGTTIALVLHDHTGLPGWPLGERGYLRRRRREPDLLGVDIRVGKGEP